MNDRRFPIGKFAFPSSITQEQREDWLGEIARLPDLMTEALAGMTQAQLDTPYREGGWTVRQVVHHVPDSHLNSYIRFRLALTEEAPLIKAYDEAKWAELQDAKTAPVAASLSLLEALHKRWVLLLSTMSEADYAKTFRHPQLGPVTLGQNLALYAWHGRHHLGHIMLVKSGS